MRNFFNLRRRSVSLRVRHIIHSLITATFFISVFIWPIEVGATGADVQFFGHVSRKSQSAFYLERSDIIAFGKMAGVRLLSSNRTLSQTQLSYVLRNSSGVVITSERQYETSIAASGELTVVIAFPLDENRIQAFSLCARQQYASGNTIISECFELRVVRAD